MDLLQLGPIRRTSREERAKVENMLEETRKQARKLIFELNSTNLAVALPEELLVEIFKFLIALWSKIPRKGRLADLDTISDDNLNVYEWIRGATHVCRRWRSVALGAPTLWTRIRVTKLELVTPWLERSGNALFDVEGVLPKEVSSGMSKAWQLIVRQHSHRVRTLKLDFSKYDTSSDTAQWIDKYSPEFPALRELSVHLDLDEDGLPHMFDKLCDQPALEFLRAYDITLTCARKLFSVNLRHLELHGVYYSQGGETVTWRELLETLKELYQLKTLRLIESLQLRLPSTQYPVKPTRIGDVPLILSASVDLPHLSLLHVEHEFGTQNPAVLIRNLAFPASAALRLTTNTHCSEDRNLIGSLLAEKSLSALATPSTPLRTLVIYSFHDLYTDLDESRRLITVAGWTKKLLLLTSHVSSTCPSNFTHEPCLFEVSTWDDDEQTILEETIVLIPLDTVQSISLGIDRPLEDLEFPHGEVLRAVFSPATSVDTLVSHGGWTTTLAEALRPEEDGRMLFPELKVLHIVEASFPYSEPAWSCHPEERNRFWKALIDTLQSRSDLNGTRNFKLKKIVIARSGDIKKEDVKALSTCAEEMIWDEWSGYDAANWDMDWEWLELELDSEEGDV